MQHFFTDTLMGAVHPGIAPLLGPGFGFSALLMVFLGVALFWTIAWKGIALWHSARNRQFVWFIVLLVVNTFGILEIVYFLFFRKDQNEYTVETVSTEVIVEKE